jgi:amidase
MIADRVNAFIQIFEKPLSITSSAGPGPLAGLTFAAKDLFDVAGYLTGAGHPLWRDTHRRAARHAPAVARLLGAGAQLVGKTHTDELAYSLMGANTHYGTPTNVMAPDRVPGGSSSGSAAAVAAELVDFALGTDTGGSVRAPASFCGIHGIRTTHGRLSLDGIVPLAPSFDTVGWFARDIFLLSRIGEVLGIAPELPGTPKLRAPADLWALADDAVVRALNPTLILAETLFGRADRSAVSPDGFDAWRETFRVCQAHEAWASHGAWITKHQPQFGPGVRERFAAASAVTQDEAQAAKASRRAIAARIDAMLEPDYVIVIPTAPSPAPLLTASAEAQDVFRAKALSMLCLAGLAGLPQISIAAARVSGAPVGFSLIGARHRDGRLLAMAAKLLAKMP